MAESIIGPDILARRKVRGEKAMTTYRIKVGGDVRMTFAADFRQAACPITLEGSSTPFQVADARHSPERAAEMLIGWTDSEGGSNVGEDEEYEIVSVGTSYAVSDGNANESAETLVEAIGIVSEWYDYMADDDRYGAVELPAFDAAGIDTTSGLNLAIGRWEKAIAEACGKKEFVGHGNYRVSAASEMGLNLRVEEVEIEEAI